MPRIFDNIVPPPLLDGLCETLDLSQRADFCVGYFNLRGWKQLGSRIERWNPAEGQCCRLLVGMQRLPEEELTTLMSFAEAPEDMDNRTALRLKKRLADDFRNQITIGAPTNEDERGLHRLAAQLKEKKVVVKLFLRHPLHAKLYLLFRRDPISPIVAYLGSSNLTLAGLKKQGELNVDIPDQDACHKLAKWFEDRWNDRWCSDISEELAKIIEESWARTELIPPYYIYVKMAYHLSQEAREGLSEFTIPKDFGDTLFDFQKAAVKIAAHHLNKRGGVLLGDVVGLGKTLMATAVARIFEIDNPGQSTVIICPKNLQSMWKAYARDYGLHAEVISLSVVEKELPKIPARFKITLIDESHNLRNREGKRYKAIQDYIRQSGSKVIMLSATPYNKSYTDLSGQLRLFVAENQDLGIRPERLIRQMGELEFTRQHQAGTRTLAAFEKSEYADDWRDLMRLYLVRRTRTFIQEDAKTDPADGRKYLEFTNGERQYFPTREPKTVKFTIDNADPADQYARLYDQSIVDALNDLILPRYGLGNYVMPTAIGNATSDEVRVLRDLAHAGRRLMGFCRTNIFKRLESSGHVFIESLQRHILRNFIILHAIEQGLELPIGTQDADLLDTRFTDEDADAPQGAFLVEDDSDANTNGATPAYAFDTEADFRRQAAEVYALYSGQYRRRFKWLRPTLFTSTLSDDLLSDARALIRILNMSGPWNPAQDAKLDALTHLLATTHPNHKVLVFTQFADTVRYLEKELRARGVSQMAGVTGDSSDPTALARRFSPVSNTPMIEREENKHRRPAVRPEDELRVLIATDVLSEGQNLQDCHIMVNYDLPWTIIRLVQRAGRVDRIGQHSRGILCYTFLPAEGVERIIRLRERVRVRLRENAEVVGTDEAFFEDDNDDRIVLDLYTEKAGLLDGEADSEVDLSSYAYQIWKNAIDADPSLKKKIEDLPPVVYSTRTSPTAQAPEGVLLYVRTSQDNDALAWVDRKGQIVTESQLAILKAAECKPDTPALPRLEDHHALVEQGVKLIAQDEKTTGGSLGRPSGARFRTYERLKYYIETNKGTLFDTSDLHKTQVEILNYPLLQTAADTLNRQLRIGIDDEGLVKKVLDLRKEDRLCMIGGEAQEQEQEPLIICSMGLRKDS